MFSSFGYFLSVGAVYLSSFLIYAKPKYKTLMEVQISSPKKETVFTVSSPGGEEHDVNISSCIYWDLIMKSTQYLSPGIAILPVPNKRLIQVRNYNEVPY